MKKTYLCPSSWAMVCDSIIPLSSFTLHDFRGLHIPPTFASPKVLQSLPQIFRRVTKIATS